MARFDPIFTAEELQAEEWRACPGFPDHAVSSIGRLRRETPGGGTWPGRILATFLSPWGYVITSLRRDNHLVGVRLHRLVALAFLGPAPEGKHWVNHKNSCRSDNRDGNLEWNSPAEDSAHRERMGHTARGERNGHVTQPERTPRGERNGQRTHPERTARGSRVGISKLTEEEIPEIRQWLAEGVPYAEIGRRKNITAVNVRYIDNGKTWKHVPR